MKMIAAERRAAASLALIYALRMLGLFLVLPVLALGARDLPGATPVLIGLAVGIYGLTQAGLQIPFGFASDRLGRKRVIAFGLLLFALGSVIAALADGVWWLILGRALQGAGAIAAALMALAADLTRDAVRTRTMAVIGISIGLSFSAALVLGPVLHAWIDLAGLFWLAAGLALIALVLLFTLVPTPARSTIHRDAEPVRSQFRAVLHDPTLLRLDAGIFVLHLIMTGTFVAAPLALVDAGLPSARHWELYLPVFGCSVALMGPLVMLADRRERTRGVFLLSIALVALAQLALAGLHGTLFGIGLALLAFFVGFNVLEATLPSLVSRGASAGGKGTAMGVYASSQFLGAFFGGLTAGALYGFGGPAWVFVALAAAALAWLLLALTMTLPRPVTSYVVSFEGRPDTADEMAARLSGLPGVEEAVVVADEGVAYLKIDRNRFDAATLAEAGLPVDREAFPATGVR